jgi:hypothetical protein
MKLARRDGPAYNGTSIKEIKMKVMVEVGRSRFLVDDAGNVARVSKGEITPVKAGATVEAARRIGRNLITIRTAYERREKGERT